MTATDVLDGTGWAGYVFAVITDKLDARTSRGRNRAVFTTEGHDDPDCPNIDPATIIATESSLADWLGGEFPPLVVKDHDGNPVVVATEYGDPWPCPCVPADALERILSAAQQLPPVSISGDAPPPPVPNNVRDVAAPEETTWRASGEQLALASRLLAELAGNPEADAIGDAIRAEGPHPTWQSLRRGIDNLLALRRRLVDLPVPDVAPGRYALDLGDGRVRFFRWGAPTSGKAKGILRLVEELGGKRTRRIIGEPADTILSLIAEAGEEECGQRYAEDRTRCYRCGIVLTDPVSKRRGLGPDCAKKWGRA